MIKIKKKKKACIPKFFEKPILGLKSNQNFIKSNKRNIFEMKKKKKFEKENFLKKKYFGQVPNYLKNIKNSINEEIEFFQKMKEEDKINRRTKILMSEDEKKEIREKLKKKYEEINNQYQKITHIKKVTSLGLKKKKIFWEKKLSQIEKDLVLMNRKIIYVDITQ